MARVHTTWTPDQARHFASIGSAAAAKARTERALERARTRLADLASHPTIPDSAPDAASALESRLTRAAQSGASPATLDKLASALARLQPRSGSRRGAKPRPTPPPPIVLEYDEPEPSPSPSPGPAQARRQPRPDQWDD
jgi:hypothetical protein